MSGIYEKEYHLKSSDVNRFQRLRTSVLMRMLQEAAIAHTEELGMGREKTLDKGLLWIVSLQRTEILRMPLYDEKVIVRSWPGKNMHVFFPRYYELTSENGSEVFVLGSALWMLLDEKTRRFVFPETYGVTIDGCVTGREIALPSTPKTLPLTEKSSFTVPFSYVDLNGHMNNTRYYDLADDLLPFEKSGRQLKGLSIEYLHEIREAQRIKLLYGFDESGDSAFLTGEDESGTALFRLRLEYVQND